MADESTAQEGVEPEVATEEAEPAEPEATEEEETEAPEEAEDTEDSEDTEEEPEEIEFVFGGNKLRVPKGALPEELAAKVAAFAKGTWADYTRKSQDLSEQGKAIEARESAVEKLTGLQGKVLDTYSKGLQLRAELTELAAVDVNAMWQSNPDQARRVSDEISHKTAEFNMTVNEVARLEGEADKERKAEQTRLMETGRAVVNKHIPDFETKAAKEVVDYAVSTYGIPREQAETWPLNPIAAITMHKAMLWDRAQAKAAKPAKPQPAPAKPVTPMKAPGKARSQFDLVKDADKMSTDDWVKAYRKKYGG